MGCDVKTLFRMFWKLPVVPLTVQTYLLIRISRAIPVLEFSGMCSTLRTVSTNVTFTLLRTAKTGI